MTGASIADRCMSVRSRSVGHNSDYPMWQIDMESVVSEDLGEVIVDKETARASYVLHTYLLTLFEVFNIYKCWWSRQCFHCVVAVGLFGSKFHRTWWVGGQVN